METLEKEKPLAAKVKVVKEEDCEITFSIELPKDEITKETDSVFLDIQRRASLPGFRTGKAPLELVRNNFADRARQTVLENLISRAASQVIRDRKLQTLDTPQVEKIEYEPNKPLSFHMKVEKDPEVKAKDYKGIKVNRQENKISDEKVSETLKELLDRNATLIASKDEKVGKAHFIVIDFVGKIDGKSFPGGSSTNYLMDMSAPQTITGFSEGILGAALNTPLTVSVTFPADYPRKEWANKKAEFHVTVKEIKEKKLPLLDNEFAKDIGFESVEDLQKKVRENLEHEEKSRSDKDVDEQMLQSLIENNVFSVPRTMLEERTQSLIKRARQSLERQGLITPEDAEADKALREKVRPQAEKDVRLSYLLRAISQQEKLEAGEKDIEDLRTKAMQDKEAKPAEIENYFRDHALSLKASLTEGKVMDFLRQNAKIKTVTK